MTRVNVGIDPRELCDQMLVGEYRELPRCFKFRRNAGPPQFTLGKGHVLWCARHPDSLVARMKAIAKEMKHRGYQPTYGAPNTYHGGLHWTAADYLQGRGLLVERIQQRLLEMKRKPTWTRRRRPSWAKKHDKS